MDWYQNPIKSHGDFADPFVLRFNGRYYLYCTNPDIRVWSSDDLVHWQAQGPSIEPDTFPGLVPFAPEVVYDNGSFYMYTSPSGHGHYVLRSDSPTGPFHKITGNVEHNIDGSVLIDDDGQWYFYWADDTGILGCRMASPTEFGEAVNTGAFLHGWTEGPMIVKYDDRYHMTYTGNHYLCRGYRIHAAVSDDPLGGYTDNDHNPIIIHTEGEIVGLGHSSTVLGPDLHTHYIVYHNIYPDATRDLNIDPILMDREGAYVYGPTRDPQPVPRMPDFYDRLDADDTRYHWDIAYGEWTLRDGFTVSSPRFLSFNKTQLGGAGVIECHVRAEGMDDAEYGVALGREGACCRIALNPSRGDVRLKSPQGECIAAAQLPADFVHTALHCLRIRYCGEGALLYIDGRKQMEMPPVIGQGDRFGYFADGVPVSMGYTAYSSGTDVKAHEELYMPVPGGRPLRGHKTISQRINVAKAAVYAINVIGETPFETGSGWSITVDDAAIDAEVRVHEGSRMAAVAAALPEGLHRLKITPPGGEPLYWLEVYETSAGDSACVQFSRLGPYGKVYAGEDGMGDCVIEAELTTAPRSAEGSAGVLFRLTEPAEGGEGADPVLGINFFIGYCVSLTQDSLILTRHRYDERELARCAIVDRRSSHRIRVEAVADHIAVYLDGGGEPAIAYRDPDPLTHGRAGIRAKDCLVERAAIQISPGYTA